MRALSSRTRRALAGARIAVGLTILVRTTPLAGLLAHPLLDVPEVLFGWPDGWSVPLGPGLPDTVLRIGCIVRTVLAVLFVLGLGARPAGIALGLVGIALLTDDVFASTHTFRLLYGSAIVLAVCDSSAVWAWRPRAVETSGATLLRGWLISIYAWAAIAKLTPGWLSGEALSLDARDGLFRPAVGDLLADPRFHRAAPWALLFVEAGLALGLAAPRARRWALGGAVLLQLAFEYAARPDVFGIAIVVLCVTLAVAETDRASPAGTGVAAAARTARHEDGGS